MKVLGEVVTEANVQMGQFAYITTMSTVSRRWLILSELQLKSTAVDMALKLQIYTTK